MGERDARMEKLIVATPFGDTTLWKSGSGPTMLIVHGGPGMSHDYLVGALQHYADLRTLYFFDQLGCGSTHDQAPYKITADDTLSHIEAIALALRPAGSDVGILAHSWGTHLTLQLLKRAPRRFSELVLVSPFPVTRTGLEAAFARLDSRIPRAILKEVSSLERQPGSGRKIMDLLLPHYVVNRRVHFPSAIHRYDARVNETILSSLGSFDTRSAIAHLPDRSIVVRGDQDFVPFDSVKPIADSARQAVTLIGVGHFPFFEAELEFRHVIRSFLSPGNG